MGDFLIESGRRANRPTLVQSMMAGSNAKYEADINTLSTVADESEPPAKLSNHLQELTYLMLAWNSSTGSQGQPA